MKNSLKQHRQAFLLCPAEKTDLRDEIKNNEASAFNKIGIQFWNEKKYATAAANFKSAFELSNKQVHKDSMKHAESEVINAEGDKLFQQKKFPEAIDKYSEAYLRAKLFQRKNS